MLYEALRDIYRTQTKEVKKLGDQILISHGNKRLSISPFRVSVKKEDGTILSKKVTPSTLLYLCACIRVAGTMRYSFVYKLSDGLAVKYKNHKFKIVFLNDEERAEEVFPVHVEPSFTKNGKTFYYLPLQSLKLLFEVEEVIKDYNLEIQGAHGKIILGPDAMQVESPVGVLNIPYDNIPPHETFILLGTSNSFLTEVGLGRATMYRLDAEVHISSKGNVLFSGGLFDSQALLSGLRSKLLLS